MMVGGLQKKRFYNMNNKINIQIFGSAGVGRSTLAKKLEEFLRNEGFNVTNTDDDEGGNFSQPTLDVKWKAIIDRNTQINIESIQTKRMSL